METNEEKFYQEDFLRIKKMYFLKYLQHKGKF